MEGCGGTWRDRSSENQFQIVGTRFRNAATFSISQNRLVDALRFEAIRSENFFCTLSTMFSRWSRLIKIEHGF